MKTRLMVLLIGVTLLFSGPNVLANSIDLSAFKLAPEASAQGAPGVRVTAGIVEFVEDLNYLVLEFSNPAFLVPGNAQILSFNYDFTLGPSDVDDFLSLEVDFTPIADFDVNTVMGSYSYDLSPLRGDTIDLAWVLIANDDDVAGTTAQVYNIDLSTVPIPEPSTGFLLALGVAGLLAVKRERAFKMD